MEKFKNMIDFNRLVNVTNSILSTNYSIVSRESIMMKYVEEHTKAKQHIFELFGNKLRIEKDFDVTVSETEIADYKREFIEFLKTDRKFLFVLALVRTLSCDEFSSNILERERNVFNVSLPKGMKLSKAISKLLLPEHQHEVTTRHSMINQKLFTKGKIVLSIDPVDYITMSSNSSGWRSCHRLDGGEYATGPLAYLLDSSTVICYVESSKPCKLYGNDGEYHYFSNKTWRQIALISPDAKFSIQERQYPNNSSINEQAVAEMLIELFEKHNDGSRYKKEKQPVDIINDLHIDYANEHDGYGLYYNDSLNEMYSEGYVVMSNETSIVRTMADGELPVKGCVAYCLHCGERLRDSENPYCQYCYEEYEEDSEW